MMERFKIPISSGSGVTFLLICIFSSTYLISQMSSYLGENVSAVTRIAPNLKTSTLLNPPKPRSFTEATEYANMMVEQKRRRALIDEACRAANASREINPEDTPFKSVGHLLVDDKYKILFGFIPKVGCTTWKSVIGKLRLTHRGDLSAVSTLRGFGNNRSEIDYRLKTYRKALFVREPITRMLSGYLNKLKNYMGRQRIWEDFIGRSIVKTYRGYSHDDRYKDHKIKPLMNITLPEYIQYITDRGSGIRMNELNDHWLPLHVVSNPCQIHYDFIGHYENLAVEGPFLLRWLGVDHLIQFPPVHQSHASESLVKEYSTVSLNLLKRLSDYYAFDYKAFGYHVDDTVSILMKGVFDEDEDEEEYE